MGFFSKVCSLNVSATLSDGSVQDFQVKYKVNAFGRAKLLNEGELPPQLAGKFKESLLAGFLSKADYKIVETSQGWRLQDNKGKIYQYEFSIELRDGSMGIPYVRSVFSRLSNFLDMRNLRLSKSLDGATIRVFINAVVMDLKQSSYEPITRVYRHVRLYNLDGSMSCAFVEDAPASRRDYREIEPLNYDLQNKWLFRHFLQFQNGVSPADKAPCSKSEEWFASRATFASRQATSPGVENGRQGADSDFAMPSSAFSFPAHMMPLSDALQPVLLHDRRFLGNNAEAGAVQSIPLFCPAAGSPAKNLVQGMAITHGGKQQAIRKENEEEKGSNSPETGLADGFGRQNDSTSGSEQERKGGKFKPIPFSSIRDFKAVIFDLDGVVVDSESAHLRSFNRLLAPFGAKITEKMWRENYTGVGSVAILKDVFARNGIKADLKGVLSKRAEIYHDVVVREGLKEIQGFSQFFALLEKNGIKAAVASGGHKPHILASMMSIGMPRVAFVGLEDVKNAKPAPDTFLLAANKLGVKPSECIIIEDSLAGMKAAAAAKMPCIALSTTLPAEKIRGAATLVVNNYSSNKLRKAISRLIRNSGKGKASPPGKGNNGAAGTEKAGSAIAAGQYPVKREAKAKQQTAPAWQYPVKMAANKKPKKKKSNVAAWQYPVKKSTKARASKGKKTIARRKSKSRKKSR